MRTSSPITVEGSFFRPISRGSGNAAGSMARTINARLVIPCHYDMFEFNTALPDDFAAECRRLKQRFHILQNGEGLDLL